MKKIIIIVTSLLMSTSLAFAAEEPETDSVPERASVCDNAEKTKEKVEKHLDRQRDSCEITVDTSDKSEYSEYWSNDPDANCDLGLKFPSIPGLNIDLSLDACAILQAVTEDLVKEINDTTQGVVDDVAEDVMGDKDGLDLDLDAGDYVDKELDN